jgi:DnaD/phage-associated family protein
MKKFAGFPARMDFTSIPNLFLNVLVPEFEDITELKTVLAVFTALYQKKGHLRFVTAGELECSATLMRGLKPDGETPGEVLKKALLNLVEQGILLHLSVSRNGKPEDIYFLNSQVSRDNIVRIKNGEMALEGMVVPQAAADVTEQADIFTLYEQNIGVLTPMIADQLREAVKLYPREWITDAIREAVSLNKRNWRYVERVLERWFVEGRVNGAHKRHSTQDTDPDRFIKGKYGHMVQR